MTDWSALTAGHCEDIFHAALKAGDARGVEAALMLLAVRDPHRAQVLLDITRFALDVARSSSGSAEAGAARTSVSLPTVSSKGGADG